MPDIGFLNGEFMPLNQVRISIEDRGFQFGDGVYEVLRTYGGVPFQLNAHLERLERSALAIGLNMPVNSTKWEEWIREGIKRAGYSECKVYVQVTRGVAPRDHLFPNRTTATIVMSVREMHPLNPVLCDAGVVVMTMDDLRWGRCDIKSINLLPNVLARQRALEAGAFEAILFRGDTVTEGAVSNVMIVRAGHVITPPEGMHILSGVTRQFVLNLARKDGIPVEERNMSLREFRQAEEVFLTGTTIEVLPVVRIDNALVGSGHPGLLTKRLRALFLEQIE
ncbi:MAG TPA: D-amino-acid transaminase [Candidatus Udaeobacter sp.]|nr:D-amino-acid transaminase [Candidatus Udaeobacter sp.]